VADQPDYTPASELEWRFERGFSGAKKPGAARRVLSSSTLTMRKSALLFTLVVLTLAALAQNNRPTAPNTQPDYSGMYTFLTEGEFVQLNLEEGGKLTGYVSRYGSVESDRGAFLDQFFKTASLKGEHIEWTTEPVHGVWYEFKGTIGRGSGKTPDNEGYYAMRGTLAEHTTDAAHKESVRQREVVLKSFPQGVGDDHENRD
jgi:hypothetical protein